ncbi:hypothetical protein D5H75_08270 [Bailinhaonella thermotolerans]|uniref:Uncharacterized protein n=2 Tax=Bailinhaonella thermotolerans TaxID=1070861 RepID=A0A3A4B2L0_9ACTN|nr:hypothetical protein D5H75_08270 [Bailinhaonella thermotolerans]
MPAARARVRARLAAEFLTVPVDTVDRYVCDVWICAEHLGVEATPPVVERIARERLLGLIHSEPPSSRPH